MNGDLDVKYYARRVAASCMRLFEKIFFYLDGGGKLYQAKTESRPG